MALINFPPKAKIKPPLVALALLILTFSVYKLIYPQPRNWYNHYYYQSLSFINLQVDIPNLPDYFQDKITLNNRILIPFPPAPSLVLIPFVLLSPNFTQQSLSILLGSLNVSLLFLLLNRFTSSKNSFLLSLFFAFGTVHFWSSVVGTTWYFAHITAIFFLLLSLLSYHTNKHLLTGFFFGLAVLSRLPLLLGLIFFFLKRNSNKSFLKIILPALLLISFYPILNYLRFGNIFNSGYQEVYQSYVNSNYPFTIIHKFYPNFPYFRHLDPRNIPLHIFTFLAFPPLINSHSLTPSPYGMGILFTSPLLLLALKPPFKKSEKVFLITAISIALIDFMHYMQGWVQFGYRFALDFIIFLIIILALRFKPNKFLYLLLLISIIVNTWGTYQAINLGW